MMQLRPSAPSCRLFPRGRSAQVKGRQWQLSACQRVTESDAWQTCCGKYFPDARQHPAFGPHYRDAASIIGMPLRHMVISHFSGANEKEKLDAVFCSAPPWLIWHTFGDYTAELLGLKTPDLSHVRRFARSEDNFKIWYGVPPGAFECQAWPDGPEREPLAAVNLHFLVPGTRSTDKQIMTSRERRRHDCLSGEISSGEAGLARSSSIKLS